MTAAPGPQQPDEDAFVTLVRTLLLSYTPFGAVSWLTGPNRGLNSRRPIDKWSSGFKREVQQVADLIDGGLPAAPSAQPDEDGELNGILALDAVLNRLPGASLRQRSVRRIAQLLYADGVRVVETTPTPPPSLSQQRRRAEQDGSWIADEVERARTVWDELPEGARPVVTFPAQPVRDTGEGRR